ncbi:hypothetical protein ACQ4PT_044417 [Festuca glaucescens]
MALRSLLRKMPALGGRPWPTAPLTGPVQKLSPAAGSRLLSTDLPPAEEGAKVYSLREEIKLVRAQIDEDMKEIHSATGSIAESFRREAEDLRKGHEKIRKACAVYLALCVPVAILITLV